jgi:cytochrome c
MLNLRKLKSMLLVSSIIMGVMFAGALSADGDAARGEELFGKYCSACHNTHKGAKPDMYGVVLPLYGVVGKEAGKTPGFFYSKAMRDSGVVWDEGLLDKYLEDPKGTIPGIRMEFPGVPDAKERKDIIAHMKAVQSTD